MCNIIQGNAHVYGDNIDTDRIIPGKYTKTLDIASLADHVLEDLDPKFSKNVNSGDVIVAGENFGCGSSREQAPLAIKAAGVSLVIAKYFARIFFRNAINVGLPVIEIQSLSFSTGDVVEADLKKGIVRNITQDTKEKIIGLPNVMQEILDCGGLVNYLKKNRRYTISN